jgi:uroporphyrinogen decarboxylase
LQTPRECVSALFRKERADRYAFADNPWGDTLERWVREGYPTGPNGKPVSPVDHFGFDLAGVGGWFDSLPIRGPEQTVEETDEWVIKKNGAGALLKWWKNRSGTPEHIAFHMTSRKVWESDYRPHLLKVDRARLKIEESAKELKRRRDQGLWTHYGHLFVWENMRRSMGDVCLYESMLLDPAWIHDYCRVYTDFFKAHYRLLLEEAGLPDGAWLYEDLGYKNATFCSPKTYGDLIFPYFREMVDFFHGYGLPVVLHTCGYTETVLDLTVEAGFDGLNPMEVKAGNDPLRFAERYADRFVFIGGLDARVLESGDRDLIRREVVRLIEGMKQRGARYVFGSDHSLSTRVPYADFQFALAVYREHMGL